MIDNIESLDVKLYKCFSQRLSHAIQTELGIQPVKVYQHKNGRLVNLYIMTPQLSQFLKAWTANNPKSITLKGEKT